MLCILSLLNHDLRFNLEPYTVHVGEPRNMHTSKHWHNTYYSHVHKQTRARINAHTHTHTHTHDITTHTHTTYLVAHLCTGIFQLCQNSEMVSAFLQNRLRKMLMMRTKNNSSVNTSVWTVVSTSPSWKKLQLVLFQYPFHSCVTTATCRWQTAKHACTLCMWLCVRWHSAWLYGVHRARQNMAAVSCGTKPVL